MNDLTRIERRLLELTGTFDLRPTLEKAADIGDLLIEARSLVRHGDWAGWLERLGLRPRTAWDYVAVARARDANRWPATEMGIKEFLSYLRKSRRAARAEDREQARADARRVQGELLGSIVLANADCRTYTWPRPVDLVYADPPWKCVELYAWLATWASEHLRQGGLTLVQCGQHNLPEVMAALGAHLTYVWTLNVVYSETQNVAAGGRFRPGWRPVLMYAKGQARIHESLSDTYTVRKSSKTFHEWEQPAEPWRYWLARLARSGSLVADVCAGSGQMALVCHELGLKYVGTEVDPTTFEVARGRVLKAIKGESVGLACGASSPE